MPRSHQFVGLSKNRIMRKLLTVAFLAVVWIAGSSFSFEEGELTKEDRKRINNYLKKTKSALVGKIKSLSVEQWNYKPTPEVWSAAEIAEHILKAESVVLKRVDNVSDKEYKPELMASIEKKTQEVLDFTVGRATKLKAPEPVAPTNAYATPKAFIEAFAKRRNETNTYVKNLEKPIKAYYETFGPIGEVNGYHWLLFISAHTERHIKQLEEVLNHPQFPS